MSKVYVAEKQDLKDFKNVYIGKNTPDITKYDLWIDTQMPVTGTMGDMELGQYINIFETVNNVTTKVKWICVEKNENDMVLFRSDGYDMGELYTRNLVPIDKSSSGNNKYSGRARITDKIKARVPQTIWGNILQYGSCLYPDNFNANSSWTIALKKYAFEVGGITNPTTEQAWSYGITNACATGWDGNPYAINTNGTWNTNYTFNAYLRPSIKFSNSLERGLIDADGEFTNDYVVKINKNNLWTAIQPTYTKTEIETFLQEKQDNLTAGSGIDITNNVISTRGMIAETDLRIDNGTDLVIKGSETALRDIAIGATIYVTETINSTEQDIPYTLVEKKTNSVILCRNSLLPDAISIYSHNGTNRLFELNDVPTENLLDEFFESTYLPRLSSGMQNLLVNETFSVVDHAGTHNCTRKVIIPLDTEVSSWNFTKAAPIEFQGSNQIYFTRTQKGESTYSGYRYSTMRVVTANGSFDTKNTDNASYIRPVIAVNPAAIINSSNKIIVPTGQYELIEVDKIQYGTKLYKIKDLEARELLNKPPYDLSFIADANELIDSRSTNVTVTNAYLTALVPLDELLLKSDRYDKVELCGGFHYTDPNLGFLTVVPATLSYNAIIPNQVAQQMLPTVVPGATINSKDALLVRITPVYNDDAYQASFVIWEDEDDVRQIAHVGS